MNERWNRRAVLALVIVAIMLAPFVQLGRVAGAQEATPASAPLATPAGAPLATPVPGAQTWHVLVNNVSPDGENWSFNTFYPDHLQAHPGDAIVFTLAPNPNAFHTVMVLKQDITPLEMYEGFAGGFVRPLDPSQPDLLQSTYFETGLGPPPCGRPDQDPCPVSTATFLEFGISSAVLVNPPPGGNQVNTSFTVTLDPALPLGPYFFTSLVDGPTMIGWIEVVAPDNRCKAPAIWRRPPNFSTRRTSSGWPATIESAIPRRRRTRTARRPGRSTRAAAARTTRGCPSTSSPSQRRSSTPATR